MKANHWLVWDPSFSQIYSLGSCKNWNLYFPAFLRFHGNLGRFLQEPEERSRRQKSTAARQVATPQLDEPSCPAVVGWSGIPNLCNWTVPLLHDLLLRESSPGQISDSNFTRYCRLLRRLIGGAHCKLSPYQNVLVGRQIRDNPNDTLLL